MPSLMIDMYAQLDDHHITNKKLEHYRSTVHTASS